MAEGAQQQQWTPTLDYKQTRELIKTYNSNPQLFSNQLPKIRNHAQHHNIPFYEGDFSLVKALKQAGVGFVEGFTTLNIGKEHPDNEWVAVARSLGHLAGFAPGILSGPLGMLGKATKIESIKNAALAIRGVRGIPLKVAEDVIQPRATKMAQKALKNSFLNRTDAFRTFRKFVEKDVVEDIASGAFKLGTASAISSWQGGVDQMMHGFFSGAIFGGGFAALGNIIGKNVPGQKPFKVPVESEKAEKFARGLAGSLFQGLPSTVRGATTPEQIYEYLMGAYFGSREKPWTEKRASKELQKGLEESRKSPKSQFEEKLDPEMFSNWENIPTEVRPVLRKMAADWVGQQVHQAGMAGYELAKALKVPNLDKRIGKKPEDADEVSIVKEVTGVKPKEKAPEKKVKTKTKKVKPVTPQENIKESRRDTFILTSGDKGIQQVVSQETYKAGLTEVQALNESQGIPRHKTPNTEQIILKPETLDKANDSIGKAIEVINQRVKDTGFGKEINTVKYKDYYLDILRRDAAKLDKNYVDTVISIEPLNGFMNETKGLSRIPTQIAINKGKKVFNFDENFGWSKYNPKIERFEKISTMPELSRRTAFFGTNDPSDVQIGQIQNLFKNHVSRGFKEEIVAKVQKSEESDKIDTIEYSEAEMAQSAMDYKLSSIFQYGLNDIAKTIQSDNVARYNTIAKIADKAGKIVTGLDSEGRPFLEKGKRTNSLDWIDAIESQLRKEKGYEDVTLPDNVKRTLRQWLVTQNQAYPIYSGGYEPGEGINIIGPETPFTKSGVFRKQEGPMKLIEEVFIKASGKDIDTSKEPLIVNFSDITYKKSDGTKIDVELSRIEQVIARDYAPRFQKYKDAVNAAKKVKSIIIKDIIKEMEKKHDMHIWGGEGDKDKMVFVKYHPDYKKVKLPELPKDSYEFALQEYGIDRVTRDKMTKSIIKYTEGLNDGRPIEQIAGQPGFIKNAIHDNKRNPLWMSNGWRGDKEFWKNTANHGQNLKLTKVRLPNIKVKYDANIKSTVSDRFVGAQTDKANNQILVDPNRLLLDFQNKAWTKPKIKGVKPLPENAFKDYAEYEAFVIRHEKAHFLPENIAIKDLAARENHANDIALGKRDGNAKAVFVKSPAELESLIGVENAKILQSVDGGIIMTRPTGIAMRADKGVPDSGQEKSIAVIPSPDGTKLMKYMMHETTPEGSKMMENYVDPATGEVGINYIVYDSAVKQSGNFPIGNYKIAEPAQSKIKIIKSSSEIEQEWNTYVDTPNPTDPNKPGSKLIIRRNDHFLKRNRKTGKMVDMFDPIRSKTEFANTMTKRGKGKYIYNEVTDKFEDITKVEVTEGKLELTEGAKIFEIDPGDFRYNYGVYDSAHSIGLNDAGRVVGLQAPKQMIMMPNDAYPGITNEVVKDYVDTLSGQSFKGQDGPNKKVMEYVSTKDKTLIDDIIKDFDNVGIKEIEAVLRDKGSEPLAEKMLLEILKTNKTQIETLMGEGEMSSNNSEAVKSAIDFNGTADNIIKHAAALKKPAISLLFDKYTRPYVENALNKFVANRVSKPKIKNSMKARIRPYDKFIQEKIPELNNDKEAMKKFGVTAEDLFFLDNYAKQIPIFAKIKGYEKLRTLEDYWKAFNTIEVKKDKKLKQEFLDIFDAVNIRVPVDAISGAQVLRFGGFTDVQGHGVLMHGRKIELLGGADHDADTAFVFFGGRKADGSGEGMKKEWTNMFRANKDEFIIGQGKPIYLKKIISGFQTGVDQFGLEIGKKLGYETGGTAPKGFYTTEGKQPALAKKYGVSEISDDITKAYTGTNKFFGPRTEKNILDSDGTVIWGNMQSSGSKLTKDLAIKHNKPYIINPTSIQMRNWLSVNKIETLNTAGNRKPPAGFRKMLEEALKMKKTDKEMIDPKKLFHKDIVLDKDKLMDLGIDPDVFDWANNTRNKHPYMQFTPDIRMYVGQSTAESRNAMGPVVSLTQNMRAGWHSVRQSVGKTEEIESGTITHKWKKVGNTKVREALPPEKQFKFRVSRKAKEPNIEQQWLSSALIRFTADPANELGLIPFSKMKSLLNQLYFEKPLYEVFNPKKGTWTDISKLPKTENDYWKNFFSFQTSFKRTLSDNHFKESRYDLIDNINRAFFGFDYINKKDFSYEQKQEMVKRLTDLSENELSTAMPKMGEMLREVDFRVSIYDKVDKDGYYAMMQKQKEIGKTLAKTTDYKKLLDRTVLYRPQSKYIDFAFDVNLNNPFVRKNFSENIPSLLKKLDEFGIKNDGKLFPKITKDDLPSEAIAKIKALEEVTKDFLSNSVDEIGTLNSIIERYGDALKAGKRIPESEMLEIAKEVEAIKQLSAVQYRKRKEAIYDNETTDLSRLSEAEKVLHKMYFPDVTGKKPTKLLDQSQLDARINAFKENLSSKYAKDVFDLRLLGSLRSENTIKKINEFLQSPKKDQKNELFRDVVKELYKTGAKSSTTKVAYDSNAVDSKNILRFLKAKNDLFTGISVEPPKKVETAIENLKKTKEFQAIQAESNIDIRKAAHPLVEVNGFENLTKTTKESKLFDWQKKEILELANWLKHEPDFKTERLNETIMGIYQKIDPQALSKTLDQININDVKLINKYFRTIKEGTAIQRIEDAVNKYKTAIDKASLKRRNHFQFVEGINEEMMREHLVFLPTQGFFKTKDGSPGKFATVYKPTYYGEVLMNWASRSAEQSSGKSAEINNKFINDLRFLNQVEEQGVNPLGLYQLAIARYELQTRDRKKLDKDWYQINWEQLKKHWDWDKSREANFNIDFGDGKGRVKVTGADIVNKIQSLHRETYDNLLSIQQGKPGALEKYHIPGAYWEGDITQPKLNWKKFRDDLIDDYNNNRLINIDIGSDGIRHMLKSYMAENMPITEYSKEFTNKDGKKVTHKINLKQWLSLPKKDRKLWTPDSDVNWAKLSKMKIFPTKNRAGYYPHLFNSKSEAMKGRTEEVAALQKRFKDGEISPEHYFNEWASIENKYARRLGDYNFAEYEMTDIVDMALFPELKKHLSEQEIKRRDMSNLPSVTQRAGHSYERSDHQPGWIIDPAVNTMYIKNTVDGMYRQISNFMTRITLNTMKEHMQDKWVNKAKKEDKKDGQELVNNWLTFWHNYAREAQGMPSVVTTEMWNNPKLYYSNTPAGWFADNIVSNKVNKIADKLGLTDKDMPEGLKGTKAIDMQKWSQVEARFQLATLMTHPKTPINNIFGGSLHTFQSVGYEPMRKARDYDYLQTLNPKWKTRKDVYDSMDKHGIQAELLRHEYGFDKSFQSGKNKKFMDDLSEKVAEGKEVTKELIVSTAKERGISERIVDIAGKYMSIPEKMLRTDAFLTHYIKAWERFGGAIKDPEHPFLIELAKKGVKATQFLYNAPNRPAIARSGLGKTMTRFQLWSWNAVRFRNDVRKQAKLYGFKPGTEAMKKFERMMQVDMFVLALGSVFMYSLFGQIIPAPYNWLQDTAEWVLGDEKERNKAFFGMYPGALAPLQMITPPIARFPIAAIREFAEDDYNKLADYYVYTMFPFGRQIRDLVHPESNIIENPMRAPEKLLGIPLTGMAKEAKKRKREPKFESSVPGLSMY